MPLSVVRQRAGSSIKFDHRRYEFVVVMPNPNVLEIHPRAEFAIEHLAKPVQERVWNVIDFLHQKGATDHHVKKLAGLNNLFMTRAPNNVRIIFSFEDNTVTIQDVLDPDKFQRLQRLYVTSPLPKNDD
jgi:mRNA-degrading endonuclease RelE of RelBE toxin-antitoxin system